MRVDEKARLIYFEGVGHEKGRDAVLETHLYRVGFDGSRPDVTDTRGDATHDITFSPTGDYFVDSYSTPVTPATAVLRDAAGKLIATVEKSDISEARRLRLETADSFYREGAGRPDRSLRADVPTPRISTKRRNTQ